MPYVVGLLQASGVKVAHNKVGPNGSADWKRPYEDNSEYEVVLHHVSSPLVTIEECLDLGDRDWDFICSKDSRISLDDSVLLRAMKYWLYWNQRAQAAALWTYRLESMPGVLDKVLEVIGHQQTEDGARNVKKRAKNYRRLRVKREARVELTFEDLLKEDRAIGEFVAFTGKSYGYKETT